MQIRAGTSTELALGGILVTAVTCARALHVLLYEPSVMTFFCRGAIMIAIVLKLMNRASPEANVVHKLIQGAIIAT